MTAYKKICFAWALIMLLEFSFGLGILLVSNWFMVPFFGMLFCAKLVLVPIVCPRCDTSVTYQGTYLGKRICGGFIRRKCQECGWDLNKNP